MRPIQRSGTVKLSTATVAVGHIKAVVLYCYNAEYNRNKEQGIGLRDSNCALK
jgi:hypothetical protein